MPSKSKKKKFVAQKKREGQTAPAAPITETTTAPTQEAIKSSVEAKSAIATSRPVTKPVAQQPKTVPMSYPHAGKELRNIGILATIMIIIIVVLSQFLH